MTAEKNAAETNSLRLCSQMHSLHTGWITPTQSAQKLLARV